MTYGYREESRRSWVAILLEEVSSVFLSEVEISVWFRSVAELGTLKLPLLEKILTSSRFPALRRVAFTLYRERNTDDDTVNDGIADRDVLAEMRAKMPVLTERDILVLRLGISVNIEV